MRRMVPIGILLIASAVAAQTTVESLVQRDLEKTQGMSAEDALSYVKRTYSMADIESLGPVLEAYRNVHGRYPAAASISELATVLDMNPGVFPFRDKWGTEPRYVVSGDGTRYTLVIAGSDAAFDEASWTRAGALATDDEDVVFINGAFTRKWTDATKRGAGPRGRLKSGSRALLAKADAQLAADDRAGALASYMEAVKADANAASLETIRRYAPAMGLAAPPPPPPPPPAPGAAPARPASASMPQDAKASHAAALRQYLELHPGDREATRELVAILPPEEALQLADDTVAAHAEDPSVWAMRGLARISAGRDADALSDFEKAATLDAANPERHYTLGTALYNTAKKIATADPARAQGDLRRSVAALERAETLRPDYREAIIYRSLVLRELAALETDPAAQQKLNAEADAVRAQAMELMKNR